MLEYIIKNYDVIGTGVTKVIWEKAGFDIKTPLSRLLCSRRFRFNTLADCVKTRMQHQMTQY